MSTDALELSPDDILAKHGIAERHARAIVSVYFTETWPRIESAIRLRGLWRSSSRIRHGQPWKRADAFNILVRAVCTAETENDRQAAVLRAPPVLIRRLSCASGAAFACFGHQEFDAAAYRLRDLTAAEATTARSAIADLISVDPNGEPLGLVAVEWFADWRMAMKRTAGQFLWHARMFRSMS
jgi:hypothetical protein